MPTTYTVTGNIFLPSGKVPPNARVRFKLVQWLESGTDVIAPDAVEATVTSGGDFSAVVVPATYRISVISDVQGNHPRNRPERSRDRHGGRHPYLPDLRIAHA